jgi:hypothetical protein
MPWVMPVLMCVLVLLYLLIHSLTTLSIFPLAIYLHEPGNGYSIIYDGAVKYATIGSLRSGRRSMYVYGLSDVMGRLQPHFDEEHHNNGWGETCAACNTEG